MPDLPDPSHRGAAHRRPLGPALAEGHEEVLGRLVPAFVGRLPQLIDDVGAALREQWPDYARFLGAEREVVLTAAEPAMHRLASLAAAGARIEQRAAEPGPADMAFEEIGAMQWREGHELTRLTAAYHVGARVAWRHLAAEAQRAGAPPDVLTALAEAVFVFVDRLSSASARGYLAEQTEAAGARERLRDELAEMLLSDRSGTLQVQAAAARAGWTLPSEATVVFVEPSNPLGAALLMRLDPTCLRLRRQGMHGAIVPDPGGPGRRQRLARLLHGAEAIVGPSVALENLPKAARIALVGARLRREGVLTDDPVFVDEHLDAVIVHRDAQVLRALRRRVLAPLDELSPASRLRLEQTLTAWIGHHGDRQAVAAALHVHPQTVRYRLGRLHDLFGSALEEPETLNRLTLALAWGPPTAADLDTTPSTERSPVSGRSGSAPSPPEPTRSAKT